MRFPSETMNILTGDCLSLLPTLDAQSVQCVVTSPPYFGLRDYGVDGQIGLEETPAEYVEKLVAVFREVWRVLMDDGTLWLNLGDSYNGYPGNVTQGGELSGRNQHARQFKPSGYGMVAKDAKPKDLLLIPARVALALQADGWYLRSDIIWHKPNPMPESVTDRPTKAHEYIFLLAKQERYYYDAEAIQEPQAESTGPRSLRAVSDNHKNTNGAPGQPPHSLAQPRPNRNSGGGYSQKVHAARLEVISGGETSERVDTGYRNKRSVWTVPTHSYSGAHFATFPPKLIEPCILAGSREGDTVLDPFAGAGTTGLVSIQHHRKFVGIELNPAYVELAKARLANVQQTLFPARA